jgi:hypothetical protein
MRRLIHKQRVPYGGSYRLNLPDKGMVGEGGSFEKICEQLRAYRRANAIPIGLGFEADVERELCVLYAVECEDFDPNMPEVRRLGMDDVVRGTKVLAAMVAEWAKYLVGAAEHPLVDQETANKRAERCATCKYNVTFNKPCSGLCPELAVVVKAIKGSRTTPHDHELRSCSICGCYTAAHVWPRLDLLDKGLNDEQRKQFTNTPWCWKQTGEKEAQ